MQLAKNGKKKRKKDLRSWLRGSRDSSGGEVKQEPVAPGYMRTAAAEGAGADGRTVQDIGGDPVPPRLDWHRRLTSGLLVFCSGFELLKLLWTIVQTTLVSGIF